MDASKLIVQLSASQSLTRGSKQTRSFAAVFEWDRFRKNLRKFKTIHCYRTAITTIAGHVLPAILKDLALLSVFFL